MQNNSFYGWEDNNMQVKRMQFNFDLNCKLDTPIKQIKPKVIGARIKDQNTNKKAVLQLPKHDLIYYIMTLLKTDTLYIMCGVIIFESHKN